MVNEQQTSIRLPADTLKRAVRLARLLKKQPQYAGLRMTASAALRLALLRGLDVMEKESR